MEILVHLQTVNHNGENAHGSGGRFGLALAATAVFALLVLVLDRIGAPASLILGLGCIAGFALLAVTGIAMRTMRISGYFAAGRSLPARHAALALGGMALALAQMQAPAAAGYGGLAASGTAIAGGLLLVALVLGPLLRKSGAFSLAGLLIGRFPGAVFRLAVLGLLALVAGFTGLAGLQTAASLLHLESGFAPGASLAVAGLVVALAILPSGLAGTVWLMVAAAGCVAGALVLSLALLYFQHMTLPLPLLGDQALLANGLAHLEDFTGAGAAELHGMAPAFGFAVLLTLSGLPVAGSSPGQALRAGLGGLIWSAALALAALAMVALSVQGLREMVGQQPDRLPDAAYAASARGELRLCGKSVSSPPTAQAACAAVAGFPGKLRAQDMVPALAGLVSGLVLMSNPPVAPGGLILAGLMVLQLAMAASSLQFLAGALAHEGFFRLRDRAALTSRRLALARLALLLAVSSAVTFCAHFAPDPRWLFQAGLGLAAALVAPLLALALWPLATARDAAFGLAVGVIALMIRGPGMMAGYEDFSGSMLAIGALSFGTGIAASFFHADTARPRWFFRALLARGEILEPDKGA